MKDHQHILLDGDKGVLTFWPVYIVLHTPLVGVACLYIDHLHVPVYLHSVDVYPGHDVILLGDVGVAQHQVYPGLPQLFSDPIKQITMTVSEKFRTCIWNRISGQTMRKT